MRKSVLVGLCLLTFTVIVAADTRVDINPNKNFALYKTFSVEVAAPIEADGEVDRNNTIVTDRYTQAVSNELLARGLEPSSNPDLLIHVASRETERTVVVGGPYGYGYGWGYGWGWGGYWDGYWGGYPGGYWGPGGAWSYNYIEDGVAIDVRERTTGDLVYRARVTREAEDDAEDMAKHARKIVQKAFGKYPIRRLGDDD